MLEIQVDGHPVGQMEIAGHLALGFDTGLDSRAFAQAKMARYIAEPGFIVHLESAPDASAVELWRASGVIECARPSPKLLGNGQAHKNLGAGPTMAVWGPPFSGPGSPAGERLDALLGGRQDAALAAIRSWIQAVLALKKNAPAALSGGVPLWPCAAIVQPAAVFFAPPGLAMRCLMRDETTRLSGGKWYVHPDLDGMNAAVFTAAAMLYRVFAGAPPFPATDEITLHQDMREGNFLPVRLAVPGLDGRISALMQAALASGKSGTGKGKPVAEAPSLDDFLTVLQSVGTPSESLSPFIVPLSEEERLSIEKETSQFLKVAKASVTTRRFVTRNATLLLCGLAAVVVVMLVAYSFVRSRATLPTTAGMDPVEVIESYYHAFGELDHQMMDACVLRGVGKDDISMVTNLFVISKVRQAYEYAAQPIIISAEEWQGRGGGPVGVQVFGVTDLRITGIGDRGSGTGDWGLGSGDLEEARYFAEYTLWVPAQFEDSAAEPDAYGTEAAEDRMPVPYQRSDELTLVQQKGNWRISKIRR